MDKLRATLIQTDLVWEKPVENLALLDFHLSKIEGKTDLIILPEMFTTGFSMNAKWLCEDEEGPSLAWMKSKAVEYDASIFGSLIITERGKYFNRLYCVDSNGNVEHYDKKYLFTPAGEGESYSPGTDRLIINVRGWRICPMICYDLRFPEWSRNTVDFDLLIYVANWPVSRVDHWTTLLKARAIENQCYSIGVNRVGMDGYGLYYSGHSSVYNYNGDKLYQCAHQTAVVTIDLYKPIMLEFRENLPFLADQESFSPRVYVEE